MYNKNVQLRKYTVCNKPITKLFNYINKWLIIVWKKCFIFNLQEVSDMLAPVLIAEVWSLRKSHFWLTSLLLILFLVLSSDRAECACFKNPGTLYARTVWSRFTKQARRIHSLDQWYKIRDQITYVTSFRIQCAAVKIQFDATMEPPQWKNPSLS